MFCFRQQQDIQELPGNLRLQSPQQRAPRRKIHMFKEKQDFQKENEEMSSSPIQDNADQTYTEDLFYTLISHKVLKRPSGNSAEEYYENIPCKAERPRECSGGTETEYSLLRVSSMPKLPPFPGDEYELLMPTKISPHSLQSPCLLKAPSETHFYHL
ncbi:Germinal center B-cell-expressed transcript 2 protein [Tupaia chinensis]|uniref:Germinal center B-cell-expressed transcript 2 protein n=1 Tax=Tupaia chinensis TaxID=246437 RepID=L9KC19_TUPCH|nr:Germinal center B-cell-expressed transcript 2 protein [Tupaia chinensis]